MAHNTLTAPKSTTQLDRLSPEWQRALKDIPGALDCIQSIDFSTQIDHSSSQEGMQDVHVLREHLAALFEHAFKQLSAEGATSLTVDTIKKTVSTTILEMVIDAKQQGLSPEMCAHMLQPLLVMYASMPNEPSDDIARTLVAEGLAPELIQATLDTQHIVYKEEDDWYGLVEKPLDKIIKQNDTLIIAALGEVPSVLEYDGLEQKEDTYYYARLSTKSLIALYTNAKQSGEMQKASLLVNSALQNIINDIKDKRFLNYSSVSDVVSIIDFAQESGSPELVAQTLESLRVGALHAHRDTLEQLVAALVSAGEDDIAKTLLTPGMSTVHRYYMYEPTTTRAIEQAEKQKENELFDALCAKGMPADLEYFKKILCGSDPMSAVYIPTDFVWQDENGQPSSEFKQLTRDIPELTGNMGLLALQIMNSHIDGEDFIQFADAQGMTLKDAVTYFTQFFSLLEAYTDGSKEVVTELMRHNDPNAIMRMSELLGMGEISVADIQYLSRYVNSDPVIFEQIEHLCDEIGHSLPMSAIKALMRVGGEAIERRVIDILSAYDALNIESGDSPKMVAMLATMEDVPSCVGILLTIKENANINNTQLLAVVHHVFNGYAITVEGLEGFIRVQQWTQEFGIGLEDILNVYYGELRSCLDVPNGKDVLLQIFADQQVRTAYQQKAQPLVGEDMNDTSALPRKDIVLTELELPKMLLHRLGMSEDITQRLMDGWFSYKPLSSALYDAEEKIVSSEMIDRVAVDMLIEYKKQMDGLIRTIKEMGVDDVVELIETFGITHFAGHRPLDLRDQLDNWRTGTHPTEQVIFQARADWNGAFGTFPTSTKDALYKAHVNLEEVVFFEVNSVTDIARAIVSIGNRERQYGRQPNVDTVIVGAHGNPEGIRIGTDGDRSTVDRLESVLTDSDDFIKPNRYKRHLGDHYRVILYACSTATPVNDGVNYARALSKILDTTVQGASDVARGPLIIKSDGTAVFNEGKIATQAYDSGNEL